MRRMSENHQPNLREAPHPVVRKKPTKLEQLQENVRSLTAAVCEADLPGLFVVGPGGLGKTHSVLEALAEAGIENPRVLNTHATARGLFEELFHARDDQVVLMEDMEQLYSSLPALSLLRSVLWGPIEANGTMRRTATWATATSGDDGVPSEFTFKAGIVMTANRFPRGEIFASLETRVPVVRFEVEEADVFSFMRKMVKDGRTVVGGGKTTELSERDCRKVIAHLEKRGATDLRKLHHGLTLFARHPEGGWRSLLDTILASAASAKPKVVSLPQRPDEEELRRKELALAGELAASELTPTERVTLWVERSGGRSRATYFRRVREAQANGVVR